MHYTAFAFAECRSLRLYVAYIWVNYYYCLFKCKLHIISSAIIVTSDAMTVNQVAT